MLVAAATVKTKIASQQIRAEKKRHKHRTHIHRNELAELGKKERVANVIGLRYLWVRDLSLPPRNVNVRLGVRCSTCVIFECVSA